MIVEDLDRFNDPEIFTKLRELNLLLNQNEKLNRHIRFIYAIKDDMFLDKNRAKFFDFIIPVIPHLSSSNSLDVLKVKLTKANLIQGLSTKFLYDIMLYVDDMRVLNNTVNEFIIYKENLNVKEMGLDMNKLLAIILYKNIFPNDFAAMHCHDGHLFKIFDQKGHYVDTIVKRLENQLALLEKKLLEINKEQLANVHELRSIYVQAAFELYPGTIKINIPNPCTPEQLAQETNFDKLMSATRFSHSNESNSVLNNKSTFADIEKKVANTLSFNERKLNIEEKSKEILETLSQQKTVSCPKFWR